MIIDSPYPVFVYTDHEAPKTLLTGLHNDAHGRIAKWQERLGEYNLGQLHRPAKTHFMAIVDGLSGLPTWLLSSHFAEDVEGCRPLVGHLVQISGQVTDVRVKGEMAMQLRMDYGFWRRGIEHRSLNGDLAEKDIYERWTTGFTGMVISHRESKEDGSSESSLLLMAVQDMKWRRWKKWLESGMYGAIVQARLEELEGGSNGAKNLEMGRSQRRALERTMRRYVMIEGTEPKLFF